MLWKWKPQSLSQISELLICASVTARNFNVQKSEAMLRKVNNSHTVCTGECFNHMIIQHSGTQVFAFYFLTYLKQILYILLILFES